MKSLHKKTDKIEFIVDKEFGEACVRCTPTVDLRWVLSFKRLSAIVRI